jgi:hypothetical protein
LLSVHLAYRFADAGYSLKKSWAFEERRGSRSFGSPGIGVGAMPRSSGRPRIGAGQIALLVALAALLIITGVWAAYVWNASSDVPMSVHGWIALGLGTFFSLVIGCGLMALMFFSSRSGYDDAASPHFEKRREDEDGS